MVIKTLDGLLGSDAANYYDMQKLINMGVGPGTPHWGVFSRNMASSMVSIYNAFNMGTYSIHANDGKTPLKGNVYLRDIVVTPETSLNSISKAVPYSVYTNTFTNNTNVERTVKTISLQETITNTSRTQVTSGYSLGNTTSISAEATVGVPFVGETTFTVTTEFSATYNWSKETAEETTVTKQLNIPEQEFTVSPNSKLIVEIQLFKVNIPKEDVLIQAEMYGPVTVSPANHSSFSYPNVYVMLDELNRAFPNIQFNKPDPFVFNLSPLVLNPSRQTVTINGRGLLEASLTSYQYMVNIKEVPISSARTLLSSDVPNNTNTKSYVGMGEVIEAQDLYAIQSAPLLGAPAPTPCPEQIEPGPIISPCPEPTPCPKPEPGPWPAPICPDQTSN